MGKYIKWHSLVSVGLGLLNKPTKTGQIRTGKTCAMATSGSLAL
jgi:hypothetical protein